VSAMKEIAGDLRISRVTTTSQVVTALRDRILRGDIAPGTRLREFEVAEALGVSRNTLREAMRDLVNEGLLTHRMHQGTSVAALSAEDARDLYRARRVLETAALRTLGAAISEKVLTQLADQANAVGQALERSEMASAVAADSAFHAELVAVLGSTRVSEFHSGLLRELRLGLYRVDQTRGVHAEDWAAQHKDLVRLLRAGDKKGAERLLTRHLDDAEQELLNALAEETPEAKEGRE